MSPDGDIIKEFQQHELGHCQSRAAETLVFSFMKSPQYFCPLSFAAAKIHGFSGKGEAPRCGEGWKQKNGSAGSLAATS